MAASRAAGVNVETVRYYQRVGLVKEPSKPVEGFRTDLAETADRVKFIKRDRRLGFNCCRGDAWAEDYQPRLEE